MKKISPNKGCLLFCSLLFCPNYERSYSYGKKLHPDYSDDKLFERAYAHLNQKFGENGYAKFFFEDEEYESFLSEMRKLLSDENLFIKTQKDYIQGLRKQKLI